MREPERGNVGAPSSSVRPFRSLQARRSADHSDRLGGFCKWQDIAGVFEQDRAVFGQGERCLNVGWRTDIEGLQLRAPRLGAWSKRPRRNMGVRMSRTIWFSRATGT